MERQEIIWQEFGFEEIGGHVKYVDSEEGKMNSNPTSTTMALSGEHPPSLSLRGKTRDLRWMMAKAPFNSERRSVL